MPLYSDVLALYPLKALKEERIIMRQPWVGSKHFVHLVEIV